MLRKFEEEEHNLVFVYYNLIDDLDNEDSNKGNFIFWFWLYIYILFLVEEENAEEGVKNDEVLKIDQIIEQYQDKGEKDLNTKLTKNFQSTPVLNEKINISKINEDLNPKETANQEAAKPLNFSMKDAHFDTKNYFSIEEINKSILYILQN